jgi:hypothetical protein
MSAGTDFTYALSIHQPWAWLIVAGHKDIENRSWPIYKQETLLIHAAKKIDLEELNWVRLHFPKISLPEHFTTGAIIGQAEVVGCVESHESEWFTGPYGFVLRNPIKYPKPIPYRGALGLFEVPDYVLKGAV